MMLSNVISLSKEVTGDNALEGDLSLKAKFGLNFMDFFKLGDLESNGNVKGVNSKKVLETVFRLGQVNSRRPPTFADA